MGMLDLEFIKPWKETKVTMSFIWLLKEAVLQQRMTAFAFLLGFFSTRNPKWYVNGQTHEHFILNTLKEVKIFNFYP